ncbi:hypothetical protein HaLaN_30659 [Haematococcus lacustris]|uniref:Uncharacterized protein n=1 Tax=Haematococcus lacustris TaxID=44745 RepID=A0A6A0AI76_HAELA|nr:hypothetical protein HaLaN_30659 [Haematococcus lacustris]
MAELSERWTNARYDTAAEHRRMGPGRLVLKGGEPLGGIQKKKAKKPKKVDDVAEGQDAQVEEASASVVDPSAPKPVDPAAVNVMSGKKYEEEFEVKQMVPAIEGVGRQAQCHSQQQTEATSWS